MEFIFDVETTGLPRITDSTIPSSERYKDLHGFNYARLLSISWIVLHNGTPIEQAYYIIKPIDFYIGEESVKIHGITKEIAMRDGVDRSVVFQKLKSVLEKCDILVAHNIKFDVSIVSSELFRYNMSDILDMFLRKKRICTMVKGKAFMVSKKNPKLGELYRYLYNEDITNAHDAQYDTLYCYKCYVKMFPREKNIFYFDSKQVSLTEEQEKVVYDSLDNNIIVTACAGSGKSSTMLCRIKYLLENKIDDASIIMMTFTKDAANDMTSKLASILGYTSNIKVGTIDGIAKSIIDEENYRINMGVMTRKRSAMLQHVSEYSPLLLEFVKNSGPSFFKKYSYMFIDEFQDINDIQYEIIHTFYRNGVKIFAVGDAAQNIYTFRGSNVSYMNDFEKHFDKSIRHTLTRNFRCSTPIVNFARAVIPGTKMVSVKTSIASKKPRVRYFSYRHEQTTHIIKRIEKILKSGIYKEHDIAILSPINSSLYVLEEALLQKGIRNIVLDSKSDIRYSILDDHICLATIHKSKGLEWACVFLVDVSDALLPRAKNSTSIDEDRRLFYVAVTRAKELLFLFYRANKQEPFVTRYIQDIDPKLYIFDEYHPSYTSGFSDFDVTNNIRNQGNTSYTRQNIDMYILSYFKNVILNDIVFSSLFSEGVKIGYAYINEYPETIRRERLYNEYNECIFQLILRSLCRLYGQHPCLSHYVKKIYNAFVLDDKYTSSHIYTYKSISTMIQNIVSCENNDEDKKKLIFSCENNNDDDNVAIYELLKSHNIPPNIGNMNIFKNIISHYMGISSNTNDISIMNDMYILGQNEFPPNFNVFILKDSIRRLEDNHDYYLHRSINRGDVSIIQSEDNKIVQMKYDIWILAKCKSLLKDRKRVFYVDDNTININDIIHDTLCANIDAFIDYVTKKSHDNCKIETFEFNDTQYILIRNTDINKGNTLIDIQVTLQNDVQLEWVYKTFECCSIYNYKYQYNIATIIIYNVLQGKYHMIDISDWKGYKDCEKWFITNRV